MNPEKTMQLDSNINGNRAVSTKKRLGERLVEAGLLQGDKLELALAEQKRTSRLLGEVLLDLGFVSRETLAQFLAKDEQGFGIKSVDLSKASIQPEALGMVPPAFARTHRLVPLHVSDNSFVVAMANPVDVHAIDALQKLTGRRLEILVAPESAIMKVLDERYRTQKVEGIKVEDLVEESVKDLQAKKSGKEITSVTDAPVVRLVDQIIRDAIQKKATDIHFDPDPAALRARYRIDGVLIEGPVVPKGIIPPLFSRIKIMAELNIAEARLPQDGRFSILAEGRTVDIRVSTFPTIYGESLVLRLLDSARLPLGLGHLGFLPDTLAIYEELITKPQGVILITGPTGAGKTTTLYSALSYINSGEKNIITIEDPVEYEFPNIRQTQVNPKAGITFASGLRAMFRQDPDVILVGEIRDQETMDMAMRAALTGHLVLSTLHTNDAPSAIIRLFDMGAEPFILSSCLLAVIAQRLVRVICENCKERTEPSANLLRLADLTGQEGFPFFKGKGCATCNHTGYRGRTGVFEVFRLTPHIESLILKRTDRTELRQAAQSAGMRTMFEDGLKKVEMGITDLEELIKQVVR